MLPYHPQLQTRSNKLRTFSAATNPNTAATLLYIQSDNDLDSLVFSEGTQSSSEVGVTIKWVWLWIGGVIHVYPHCHTCTCIVPIILLFYIALT